MSLLDRIKPKPEEDLYFEFKVMFDILEQERKKRAIRRRTYALPYAWYEEEMRGRK